jgi:hypothetical protein
VEIAAPSMQSKQAGITDNKSLWSLVAGVRVTKQMMWHIDQHKAAGT